jgi:hypothetical protein
MQPEADIDHELFEQAKSLHKGDIEKVSEMLRYKKGIAKAVSARLDKGRAIVSIAFDKRYSNHMSRVKGLSIEAAAETDTSTGKFRKGKLLGFTLAINDRPANPRAVRE